MSWLAFIMYLLSFGWEGHEAMAIVQCESRFQVDAVSDTGDYGLFQINRLTWEDWMFENHRLTWHSIATDPYINTYAAWLAYNESERLNGDGWAIWSCDAYALTSTSAQDVHTASSVKSSARLSGPAYVAGMHS